MYEPINGPKRLTNALWQISDNGDVIKILAKNLYYTPVQLIQDIEALHELSLEFDRLKK